MDTRRKRTLRLPAVFLVLLVGITVATALPRPRAALAVVALVAGLSLLAVVAWVYFAAVPAAAAADAVVWTGVGTAAVFLAFAVPRIVDGGPGAWVRIYEDSPWVNSNTLGLFFVIALVVATVRLLEGGRPVTHALGVLVLAAAIALDFSRSTYLAALGVVLVLCLLLRSRAVWLLVGAAVLAWQLPDAVSERVSYTTSTGGLDDSSVTRLELWQAALDLALQHPWTGVGLHTLGPELSARVGGEYTFAHNSLMTLAAGAGLVLTVLAVGALTRPLRRLWLRARDGEPAAVQAFLALIATLVCSAFGEPLLSPVVLVPLLALVAPVLADGSMRAPAAGEPSDAGATLMHPRSRGQRENSCEGRSA